MDINKHFIRVLYSKIHPTARERGKLKIEVSPAGWLQVRWVSNGEEVVSVDLVPRDGFITVQTNQIADAINKLYKDTPE